jgi:hypothetical protein
MKDKNCWGCCASFVYPVIILLKAFGVIKWPWLIVLAPVILSLVISVVLIVVLGLLYLMEN